MSQSVDSLADYLIQMGAEQIFNQIIKGSREDILNHPDVKAGTKGMLAFMEEDEMPVGEFKGLFLSYEEVKIAMTEMGLDDFIAAAIRAMDACNYSPTQTVVAYINDRTGLECWYVGAFEYL